MIVSISVTDNSIIKPKTLEHTFFVAYLIKQTKK